MKIRRSQFEVLKAHLSRPEITLLIGARQVGKTTMMRVMAAELEKNGEKCLFFNLDIDSDSQHFESQTKFLEQVSIETGGKKAFVFIDEVQRIENAGLFLKGIFDRQLPHKLVVTGSGSLELKEKIAESLVGRKRNFFVRPISAREFFDYKSNYRFGQNLAKAIGNDSIFEENALREYLTFGGYPAVVLGETFAEKSAALAEIFQGYIERDIQILLRLEKSAAFTRILQFLANRIGQSLVFNELGNAAQIAQQTLKDYLWYAEKTFLVEAVTPFFRNKEKEITKAPQYYFLDHGLRNFLSGRLKEDAFSNDWGLRFQQFVSHLLREKFENTAASIHFWRTQSQAEVDFVADTGAILLPVEVKFGKFDSPKISRSFHAFINEYRPPEAWIVNRGLSEKVMVGETQVYFRPWWELLDNQ